MIELKDVSKYYNSNGVVTVALKHVNLKLNKNEIVAITGESGSGKSTLLNIITGMDNYDEGEIYFKGNETSYFNNDDMDNFRKKHVGFIFQNYNIIDSYTVLQNVMLPLLINGVNKKEAKEKALALIEKVGLSQKIKNRGSKLSGGEKQRVIIARALASDCDILACDEPTGNLDSKTGKEIIDLIQSVAKDKLVLIVTHNYDEVKDIASRKLVVADGEIIKDEVLVETNEDEGVILNLDNKPTPKKTLGLLTKFNILATPRKTILITLIFLAISLILYAIPQSIYYTIYKSYETYSYHSYPVNMDNYLVAYDSDGLDEDVINKIDGDVAYNPILEYELFNFIIPNSDMYYQVNYATYDIPYQLIDGVIGDDVNDAILIFPEGNDIYYNFLTKAKIYNEFGIAKNLKITGIAKSKNVTNLVLKTKTDISDFLSVNLKQKAFKAYFNNKEIKVVLDGSINKAILNYSENYLPEELKLSFNIGGAYPLSVDYELKKNDFNREMSLSISPDYIENIEFEKYEARIIANDINQAKKILSDANISYIHPATAGPRNQMVNLMLLIYVILLIGPIIIFYIMSYFVLSRVYLSKKKEYAIMRTMGICKNDMKKMIVIEMLAFGSISALFIYLVTTLMGFTIPYSGFAMFTYLNPIVSIAFFAVIFIFSYSLAKRFNKKLFLNTGIKTLKEEE